MKSLSLSLSMTNEDGLVTVQMVKCNELVGGLEVQRHSRLLQMSTARGHQSENRQRQAEMSNSPQLPTCDTSSELIKNNRFYTNSH